MYCVRATRTSPTRTTRAIGWFLIVMSALSCSSAQAGLHITNSYGRAEGSIYDIRWYTIQVGDTGYGVEGTPQTSPVCGDVQYYSEPAAETFYVASEVGISTEGTLYARAHAESSSPWVGEYLGAPFTSSWSGGRGAIQFTIDNPALSLHWIAEDFEEYEDTGWLIELYRLTVTLEGTFSDLVYRIDSGQELSSEGTQLTELDPTYLYQLTWSMGIWSTAPGDHGWAQLALDLADPGDPPSPISAVVDVTADTITPRTRSITCNIRPPDGYSVTDIVVESIRLQGTVSPASSSIKGKGQILAVKFSTTQLDLQPGNLVLTVTGQLADGASFEGSDSVTVVEKGGHK